MTNCSRFARALAVNAWYLIQLNPNHGSVTSTPMIPPNAAYPMVGFVRFFQAIEPATHTYTGTISAR